jgi:alkylated DNA nucleotide flippase Atl1
MGGDVPSGAGTESGPDARAHRILTRVRAIPEGFVQTYGDLDPASPRLAGRVLATTTETVPWHRVVRADGSVPLGRRQRRLLADEGVPLRGDRVDMARAHWPDAAFGPST